ncbi:hypothetical protein [Gordonia paraffinivorans]|uniref:hypothetical protein n=1 Tax=Gordonia paraffinivorans TaxID=175628 RepID=UPI001447BA8F|nr:hypothetical protein [Gordonia paraffinivorans]
MASYSIPVTDTDAVQALLDEVQHRCTARIYDADDICKLAEKADQLLEGLPEKLRTGATVYAARSGAVAKRAPYGYTVGVTGVRLRRVNRQWRLERATRIKDDSTYGIFEVRLSDRIDPSDLGRVFAKNAGLTLGEFPPSKRTAKLAELTG